MLASYVVGEGVELTVPKEEIKKVGLRSHRAQFIRDRNYNRISGCSHAVMHLADL